MLRSSFVLTSLAMKLLGSFVILATLSTVAPLTIPIIGENAQYKACMEGGQDAVSTDVCLTVDLARYD